MYLKSFRLVSSLSRWLFEELVNINYKDSVLSTSLDRQDIDAVQSIIHLMKDKVTLNNFIRRCYFENTKISYKLAKILIKNGANIHIRNNHLLINACKNGDYDLVKILIDNHASIYARNHEALRFAIIKNHNDIIDLLICKCYCNDLHIVYFIVKQISIRTILNLKNNHLLIYSCEVGDYDVAKLLIQNGSNINAYDNAALRISIQNERFDILELLINNGANVNEELLYSCIKHNKYDLVKLLIDHNVPIRSDNDLALRLASFYRYYDIIKLLLDNGSDIHSSYDYCLKVAVHCKDYNTIMLLIHYGADLSVIDSYWIKMCCYIFKVISNPL